MQKHLKIIKSVRGFSLVEMLMALSGAIAVGLVIATIATQTQKTDVNSRIQADLLMLTDRVQASISNKKNLIASIGLSGQPAETTGGNRIVYNCLYEGCDPSNFNQDIPFTLYQNAQTAPGQYNPANNVRVFGSSSSTFTYLDDAGNTCNLGARGCRWILNLSVRPVNATNEIPLDVVNPAGTIATALKIQGSIENAPGLDPKGWGTKPKRFAFEIPRSQIVQVSQAKTTTICPGSDRFLGFDSAGNAQCQSVAFQCGVCEAFTGYASDGTAICKCLYQERDPLGSTECKNAAGYTQVANYTEAPLYRNGNGSIPCGDGSAGPPPPGGAPTDPCHNWGWGKGGQCFLNDLFSDPMAAARRLIQAVPILGGIVGAILGYG